MELDAAPSREVRRVINAIHDLSELETQIPLCQTIDEVEEIRLRCQAIQFYDREHEQDIGGNIVAWAKRCAVLCQLRITELQDVARRKRNGDITDISDVAPISRSEQNRRSERRTVNQMPKEELDRQLAAGVTDVQKLARIARKARKKRELKSSPEELEARRARYYRQKAEKQAETVPPPKRSPAQKFERYWTQEEKLLQQFFSEPDFGKT